MGRGFYDEGRVFLAVIPDARAAAKIHRLAGILKRAHGFAAQPIEPDRLHATLFFLGALSARAVRIVSEAAREVPTPPFEVSFDRTISFRRKSGGHESGGHPFVLAGGDGLNRLKSFQQRLGVALTTKGLRRLAGKDFTPHVTLMYGERCVDEYPIEPVCWTVSEFLLIHSLAGHTRLARWKFEV